MANLINTTIRNAHLVQVDRHASPLTGCRCHVTGHVAGHVALGVVRTTPIAT